MLFIVRKQYKKFAFLLSYKYNLKGNIFCLMQKSLQNKKDNI